MLLGNGKRSCFSLLELPSSINWLFSSVCLNNGRHYCSNRAGKNPSVTEPQAPILAERKKRKTGIHGSLKQTPVNQNAIDHPPLLLKGLLLSNGKKPNARYALGFFSLVH